LISFCRDFFLQEIAATRDFPPAGGPSKITADAKRNQMPSLIILLQ